MKMKGQETEEEELTFDLWAVTGKTVTLLFLKVLIQDQTCCPQLCINPAGPGCAQTCFRSCKYVVTE